jgi:SAM-dependent methyltransferase
LLDGSNRDRSDAVKSAGSLSLDLRSMYLAHDRLVGLLPRALVGASADGDLERALLLRDSLDRNWRGEAPFLLTVVTRDPDYEEVAATLKGSGRVAVRVRGESEFFPHDSGFFTIPGWWKQQAIKLIVGARLDADAVITFDADIVSIRPFADDEFFRDGRIVSIWANRDLHDWWQNNARTLGIPHEPKKWGLSVTPNVLSPRLAGLVAQEVERRFGRPFVETLADWTRLGVPGSAWTEYSLYTLVGDQLEELFKDHLEPQQARATGVVLHSSNNIWTYADPRSRLAPERLNNGDYFLVVQSTAGVDTTQLRELLGYPCPPERPSRGKSPSPSKVGKLITAAQTAFGRLNRSEQSECSDMKQAFGWAAAEGLHDAKGPDLAVRTSYELRLVQRALSLATPARRRLAIELGAGYGRLTSVLADYCGRVIGFEREPALVEQANARHRDCAFKRIDNLWTLPLDDGAADIAMTFTVLQHMSADDVQAVLKEVDRVLAPGAVLVLTEDRDEKGDDESKVDKSRLFTIRRPAKLYSAWLPNFEYIASHDRVLERGTWAGDAVVGAAMTFRKKSP